jgi:hypothetical protein
MSYNRFLLFVLLIIGSVACSPKSGSSNSPNAPQSTAKPTPVETPADSPSEAPSVPNNSDRNPPIKNLDPVGVYHVKSVTCLIQRYDRPYSEDCTDQYGDIIEIRKTQMNEYVFEEKNHGTSVLKLELKEESSSYEDNSNHILRKSYFRVAPTSWAYESHTRINNKERVILVLNLSQNFGNTDSLSLSVLTQKTDDQGNASSQRPTFQLER